MADREEFTITAVFCGDDARKLTDALFDYTQYGRLIAIAAGNALDEASASEPEER